MPHKYNLMTISEKLRTYIPWIFSCFILVAYAFFINHLLNKTAVPNEEWVKLISVFGSVEAIVFTAVGFIFGREVNRSRAINAENSAKDENKQKKELAKEVLKKLPPPPSQPNLQNNQNTDFEILRKTASRYLD